MKIYHNLSDFKKLDNAIVTIGTFDGVHFGHQKIIKQLVEKAKADNGESVILTFFPHPRMIIDPENQELKMINTINEKAEILKGLGVDHLIITPFTRDFSNQLPEDYIKNTLVNNIGTKHIIIGYDHRFGKDRSGNLSDLKAAGLHYGFSVEEIMEQDIHDVAVSSTKIRQALLAGDVSLANDYLGYPFSIFGRVIKGDKIGRTIGFPTANIFIEETYKLIPGDGIYAVTVEMDSEVRSPESGILNPLPSTLNPQPYKGMAYIGQRPTINGMTRNIEVNIFDFNQEIYGQDIKMNFLKFLRHDVKFTGLEALTVQLQKDKEATLAYFEFLS
ncbi:MULTISPECIES: bifunctional riboflavin kinase/FAD synthetase [unclassified Pedobacter]|uniref:bifunctional riboflavin kinase/FAD synthetase n=1 Tax=unclassified Pedobacter TaxID=2628915 RepID=UPI001D3B1BF2|nr:MULTISPECIES: bifunctional riboflavin kinase/FAD synthetase [unclassified Pedobacter]CAH0251786.1 Riboflavin biosynthesis protein RibF [Pedobacter sp. Bi36]CAH0276591.1 Riboflavin biosynthesis protein RibF [Pedobacter sp. Bi126]